MKTHVRQLQPHMTSSVLSTTVVPTANEVKKTQLKSETIQLSPILTSDAKMQFFADSEGIENLLA
jgi:hypothetical protein